MTLKEWQERVIQSINQGGPRPCHLRLHVGSSTQPLTYTPAALEVTAPTSAMTTTTFWSPVEGEEEQYGE